MKINVTVINFTGTQANSYLVRYARIDNIVTPVWSNAVSVTAAQFPYSFSDIDNGQYQVGIKPVYADGRICAETIKTTDACTGIIALNAVVSGANFEITYTADGTVPQVYLTVLYPNGGSYKQAYTNGANNSTILVPIPSNVYGDFSFYMQSICDPDTGFYSPLSAPVVINVPAPATDNYTLSAGYNFSIEYVIGTGIPNLGSTGVNGSKTGHHTDVNGDVKVNVSGTIVTPIKLVAYVNDIQVACIAVTATGTYDLGNITALESETLRISINSGTC